MLDCHFISFQRNCSFEEDLSPGLKCHKNASEEEEEANSKRLEQQKARVKLIEEQRAKAKHLEQQRGKMKHLEVNIFISLTYIRQNIFCLVSNLQLLCNILVLFQHELEEMAKELPSIGVPGGVFRPRQPKVCFPPLQTGTHHQCPLPELKWAEAIEVWEGLTQKEQMYKRNANVLSRHPALQPRMRAILLDWIIEVKKLCYAKTINKT